MIGIISGLLLIVISISSSGSVLSFIHIPSLMIVLGGTLAATLISFPLKRVLNSIKVAKNAFLNHKNDQSKLVSDILYLANIARREGLLVLEEAAEKIDNEFMKKGIMLVVDGTDPELVRNVLETELNFLEERHSEGQRVFEVMASLSPGFGMIGTLIGLVNMLKDLSDFEAVGPNMAVALITTFYGALFANLIFLPIVNKLKGRSKEELLNKEMILEGLLSIQAGENPRIIEEKLKTFISPEFREKSNSQESEAD